MQLYDMIMLAVVVGAALLGFRKGLAWQVASLAAIFVSYIVAVQFRDELAAMLGTAEPWDKLLAMLLLYLGTSLLIWIGFQLVSHLIERAKLKEFDRQLGAIFGATKGVLLCVIITLFAVSLLSESQRQQIIYSRSGYYIAQLLNRSERVIPAELHELLDPYLHQLDHRLDEQAGESGEAGEVVGAARSSGGTAGSGSPVQLEPTELPWRLPGHTWLQSQQGEDPASDSRWR